MRGRQDHRLDLRYLNHDGHAFRSIRHFLPGSAFVNHGWLTWGTTRSDPAAASLGRVRVLVMSGAGQGPALVVLGQRQREQYDTDVPIEAERIETICVNRIAGKTPVVTTVRHGEPKGDWRLAERWTVEQWQQRTSELLEDNWTLKSGRWLHPDREEIVPNWYESWRDITVGHEKGYTLRHGGYAIAETLDDKPVRCSYSDDRGKTWQKSSIPDPGGLRTSAFWGGNMVEEAVGTIAAPVYGYQTAEDLGIHFYSCFLVHSHDGGQTWGDWSVVAEDPQRMCTYSETSLVAFPDNTWVVFMRTEYVYEVPHDLLITRAVSADRGRTWSKPEQCPISGVYGSLLLPDGGLATAAQNTCGWGLTISYDYGRSVAYALPATYAPTRMGVLDDKTFWIYDRHGSIVSIYRRD